MYLFYNELHLLEAGNTVYFGILVRFYSSAQRKKIYDDGEVKWELWIYKALVKKKFKV